MQKTPSYGFLFKVTAMDAPIVAPTSKLAQSKTGLSIVKSTNKPNIVLASKREVRQKTRQKKARQGKALKSAELLESLEQLVQSGLLPKEEYEAKKKEINLKKEKVSSSKFSCSVFSHPLVQSETRFRNFRCRQKWYY